MKMTTPSRIQKTLGYFGCIKTVKHRGVPTKVEEMEQDVIKDAVENLVNQVDCKVKKNENSNENHTILHKRLISSMILKS